MPETLFPDLSIRLLAPTDRVQWRRLYGGYAEFYSVPMSDETADRLWRWLMDPAGVVTGYVAAIGEDVVGLAHLRPYPRSLSASWAGFLDDLYVEPSHRGRGVGRALIDAVAAHARAAGWSFVRWMTAEDNATARRLYDQVATRTGWITYQLDSAELDPGSFANTTTRRR